MALKVWSAGEILTATDLNQNFTEVLPVARTLIPLPAVPDLSATASVVSIVDATTARVGQIIIPFKITVNKISLMMSTITVASTMDIALYSEDGQTRLFSVTTGTPGGAGILTTSVSAVAVNPGVYYIMVNGNGSIDQQVYFWNISNNPFGTSNSFIDAVASEPVMQGTLTITSGTPPTTITPTSITNANRGTVLCRLDN